ncbi:MAG: folylpolyglutamate synthase/dihydrofolate synthase family protein [bacterium]
MIKPKLFKNLYNLEHRVEKTYDFNLDEYRDFLKIFQNPHYNIGRVIHVAGTNGKGSVAKMMTSILISAGYTVGTYTSPHIEKVNERIAVNNADISDREFSSIEKEVYEEIVKRGKSYRTYFEALTTLAFLYFRKRGCDFSVIEVGLGGRLDSTNVVKSEIQIITKIGLDHTDLLGGTLKKISFEKAGIIKENSKVFTFGQSRDVMSVIESSCRKKMSKLFVMHSESIKNVSKSRFEFDGKKYTLSQFGNYQRENAALCIMASRELGIPFRAIRDGIRGFKISGRLEFISKSPVIVVDGSHNPQAIETTLKEVKLLFPKKNITTVSIFMADKDYKSSIKLLKKYADNVIITEIPFFRCAKKNDYRKLNISFKENIRDALKEAISLKSGIILFIGSFYLVSYAKKEALKFLSSLRTCKSSCNRL